MPTQTFRFSTDDGRQIAGRLEKPRGALRGWAIVAHCFTCGANNIAAVRIARALADAGIGTLRFDFAASGEKSLTGSGFAGDVRDLIKAAETMAAQAMPVSLLVGHSLGGAAVLAAARAIRSVLAVATLGAPFDVAHVLAQFDPVALEEIDRSGEAVAQLAGRPFRVTRDFIEEMRTHDLSEHIAELGKALLVMHAPRDATVGVENASRIFTAARHPKSFVSLDDADHLLTRQSDAGYAASIIATWAERYLPDPTSVPDEHSEVEVEETGAGRFQLSVVAGGTQFFADEPVASGGLGSGPTPFQLLSAALAACTTMTLRLYAEHKGIKVGRLTTVVGHRKVPGSPLPDLFTRRISVDGGVSPDIQSRLEEIADRCPVHNSLKAAASFEIEFGSSDQRSGAASAHEGAMEQVIDTAG